MNDADDCKCFLCTFRRSLDEPMPAEQAQEPVTIPDSSQAIQENLMLAQTVDLLTMSLERAYNCNEEGVAAGIRRALDLVLPEAPARPTPGTANEGQTEPADTAPAAARSANAPLQTEPSDFYGLPKDIDALAKSLSDTLGCEVKVVRFPLI